MEQSETTLQLLREIRDAQRESLDEYRRIAARALELQEGAVARQEQVAALYRRVVFVGSVVVSCLIVLLLYLVSRII